MNEKINLVQERKNEYSAQSTPRLIEVTRGTYLTVTGTGSPDGDAFADAVQNLYGMAYTLKMASKRSGRDFAVAPLEGLWWVEGNPKAYLTLPRSVWQWKLLIRVPDFVSEDDLRCAVASLHARGKGTHASDVELEHLEEGLCVQALHLGPYTEEPETLERMDRLVSEKHLNYRGTHHEIYLSDPRRTSPDRIRTILRHPVA